MRIHPDRLAHIDAWLSELRALDTALDLAPDHEIERIDALCRRRREVWDLLGLPAWLVMPDGVELYDF